MKSLWTMFVNSLQLPKKQAVFTLNRIGMDAVVFYVLIFIAISAIPSYVSQYNENEQLSVIIFTIFFFIFHYLVVLIIIFTLISILASILLIITKLSKRKLHYAILWKMTAAATTIPFILFTIIAFFIDIESIFLTISALFILIIVTRIIFIYPRRRDV